MHSLRFHAFLFSKMRFLPGKRKHFFAGSSCWRFNETSYQAIITVWSVLDLWNVVAHIVIFYDIFNPLCRKVIQDHVLLYGIIFNLCSLSPSLNKTSRFLVLYFPANQCSFVKQWKTHQQARYLTLEALNPLRSQSPTPDEETTHDACSPKCGSLWNRFRLVQEFPAWDLWF